MLLGALLELGLSRPAWSEQLQLLNLSPWELVEKRVAKRGVAALHVDFEIQAQARQWSPAQVLERLEILPPRVAQNSAQTLRALIDAESQTQGREPETLTWSDHAGCDLLLDVAGFHLALSLLEIDQVFCTPLPLGVGHCLHHGHPVPNPNPAVAQLLLGKPQFRVDMQQETITTTGAALLGGANFQLPKPFAPHKVGYGAGTSEFPISNVVRLSLI